MKVAYITHYDSGDVRNWSGLGYYIAHSLEQQGIELIRIDCSVKFPLLQRIKRRWTKTFRHRIRQLEREPRHLKRVAARISDQLRGLDYDLIFSPGSLPLSYLQTTKPIAFFTDATYDCMARQLGGPTALARYSMVQGHQAERMAIQKASLIFYTSEWATQNAISVYAADPRKIMPLYFGPNLPVYISEGSIEKTLTARRERKTKSFLLMGIDWHRKGAGIAIEVVRRLNNQGIAARLTIVGCAVPAGVVLPDFVTHYPFVSKNNEQGISLLQELFTRADFFILPTQADYTPVVFSEAASYGLPVITTNVGGCASVVLDGVTGFCVARENFVETAVEKIHWLCRNQAIYEYFCLDAFYHHKRTLNWEVTGRKVATALRQLVSKHPSSPLSVA